MAAPNYHRQFIQLLKSFGVALAAWCYKPPAYTVVGPAQPGIGDPTLDMPQREARQYDLQELLEENAALKMKLSGMVPRSGVEATIEARLKQQAEAFRKKNEGWIWFVVEGLTCEQVVSLFSWFTVAGDGTRWHVSGMGSLESADFAYIEDYGGRVTAIGTTRNQGGTNRGAAVEVIGHYSDEMKQALRASHRTLPLNLPKPL